MAIDMGPAHKSFKRPSYLEDPLLFSRKMDRKHEFHPPLALISVDFGLKRLNKIMRARRRSR